MTDINGDVEILLEFFELPEEIDCTATAGASSEIIRPGRLPEIPDSKLLPSQLKKRETRRKRNRPGLEIYFRLIDCCSKSSKINFERRKRLSATKQREAKRAERENLEKEIKILRENNSKLENEIRIILDEINSVN